MNQKNHPKIPISIVTGFLGSGKTTFVNELIKHSPNRKFSVIVNEFGENSLDHWLIDVSHDEIIDLPNGCICCSSTNALIEALHNLVDRNTGSDNNFDQVIIETSGITNTANMVATLLSDNLIRASFHLAPVNCIISATQWSINPEPEAIAQLTISDNILISKADLIPPTDHHSNLAKIETQIEFYNPTAQKYYTPLNENQYENLLNFGAGDSLSRTNKTTGNTSANHLEGSYNSFTLTDESCANQQQIDQFLDILLSKFGAELLRVKGVFYNQEYPEHPLVVQAVKTVLSPHTYLSKWDIQPASSITIIHRNANQSAIEELFGAMFGQINSDRADSQALTESPLKIPGA